MSKVIAETGFATVANSLHAVGKKSDESQQISTGIGLGRVVCPAVRKRNNTHDQKRTTLFE